MSTKKGLGTKCQQKDLSSMLTNNLSPQYNFYKISLETKYLCHSLCKYNTEKYNIEQHKRCVFLHQHDNVNVKNSY